MTRTFVSVAIAAAALLAAAPATAQQPSQFLTVVNHGDLDLSTAAGERALTRRLHQAARETCGDAGSVHLDWKMRQDCRAAFLRAGRAKIALAKGRGVVTLASR